MTPTLADNSEFLEKIETINFPTAYGELLLTMFRTKYPTQDFMEYVLVIQSKEVPEIPIIRIHSSCLFGDVLHSQLCDCKEQLDKSLHIIGHHGGILFYLDQEGRGHGLFNKTKELKLQEQGFDTFEASLELNLEPDQRKFDVVADILKLLEIQEVNILTNNPVKMNALEQAGIKIHRLPIEIEPTKGNLRYQKVKKKKMGHLLDKFIK